MSNAVQLSMYGFELTVFDHAYLVEVRKSNNATKRRTILSKLPDWTFYSKHAIWLTVEKAPLIIRAAHGEKIKNRLMKILSRNRAIKLPASIL